MFDRIVNSKIYAVMDHIVKVVWLNLLMFTTLIFGFVFLSFGATILSGVYVVKLIYQKYEGSVFTLYKNAFKRFYKKATIISLIYSLVIGILTYNTFYFINQMEVNFSWIYFFAFMFNIVALFVSSIACIHTLLLYSCFEQSNIGDLIKNGLKLTFGFILRSILAFLILSIIIIVSWIIPVLVVLLTWFSVVVTIEFVLFKAYDKIESFQMISMTKAKSLIY